MVLLGVKIPSCEGRTARRPRKAGATISQPQDGTGPEGAKKCSTSCTARGLADGLKKLETAQIRDRDQQVQMMQGREGLVEGMNAQLLAPPEP